MRGSEQGRGRDEDQFTRSDYRGQDGDVWKKRKKTQEPGITGGLVVVVCLSNICA